METGPCGPEVRRLRQQARRSRDMRPGLIFVPIESKIRPGLVLRFLSAPDVGAVAAGAHVDAGGAVVLVAEEVTETAGLPIDAVLAERAHPFAPALRGSVVRKVVGRGPGNR